MHRCSSLTVCATASSKRNRSRLPFRHTAQIHFLTRPSAMAAKSRVLVVKATGAIGRPITLSFTRDGHEVFALVRPSSRQKNTQSLNTLESAGVHLVDGDIAEIDSIRSAFSQLAPVEVVVSAVAGLQVLEQAKLIQAIQEAGTVKRFLPSEFSIDIPRARAKLPSLTEPRLKIMELVQTAGIPYTVITSNGFLEDWFAGLGQVGLKSPPDEAIVFGDGKTKGVATSRENIASYTAKAAVDPRTVNKRLIIRPPDNIVTQNELINLWERISGKQVQKRYMPAEELRKNIEEGTLELKSSINYDARTYLQLQECFWIYGDSLLPIPPDGLEASSLYPEVAYTTIEHWFQQLVSPS